jgi:hypothetical protein
MPDVFEEFRKRFASVLTPEIARTLEDNLKLVEAVIEEIHGIDSGRSMAKQIAADLLTAEATQTAAPDARRIPIDERYYRPRLEPWLPGEYIPRPYYDEDELIAEIDRGIDEQRLLGRPITWCPETGAPFKW